MSFVQGNWMLILVFVLSGAMLVWPLVQRRLSPGKDVGNLEVTRLINSSHAVLLDVRETKEFEGGRLPSAIHIPLSQLKSRGDELAKFVEQAGRRVRHDGQPCPHGERIARAPWIQGRLQPSRRLPGVEGRRASGGEVICRR